MLDLPYMTGGEPVKKKKKRSDSSKAVITPIKADGGPIDNIWALYGGKQGKVKLQENLKSLGYYNSDIDGILGKISGDAVKRYQQDNNLDATGIADAATLRHLEKTLHPTTKFNQGEKQQGQIKSPKKEALAFDAFPGTKAGGFFEDPFNQFALSEVAGALMPGIGKGVTDITTKIVGKQVAKGLATSQTKNLARSVVRNPRMGKWAEHTAEKGFNKISGKLQNIFNLGKNTADDLTRQHQSMNPQSWSNFPTNVTKEVIKTRGYALGGEIGSAVGSLGDLVAPGLGSVLSPLFGTLGNTLESKITQPKMFNRQMTQVNPVSSVYEHGGFLTGKDDLSFYKGRSHKQGGIKVNGNGIPSKKAKAEVEGNESVLNLKGKTYIFSDKLKV